jgi:glutaredoxin
MGMPHSTSTHRAIALLASLALVVLAGCEGRFGSADRGLRWGASGSDAGPMVDAGRIILTFDPDAGPLPDAGALPDAGSVPDAAVATPDAWTPPPSCTPSCAGRACGSDGCGGSCGSCGPGQSCSPSQQCEPTTPPGGGGTHMITFYGASWCGACAAARAFFDGRGIAYTYRNASDPAVQAELVSRAMMLGYPLGSSVSLPVLVIDTTMTEGWNEARVRAQLGL